MGQTTVSSDLWGGGGGFSRVLRLAGIPSQTAELTGILLSLHLSQLQASFTTSSGAGKRGLECALVFLSVPTEKRCLSPPARAHPERRKLIVEREDR